MTKYVLENTLTGETIPLNDDHEANVVLAAQVLTNMHKAPMRLFMLDPDSIRVRNFKVGQ